MDDRRWGFEEGDDWEIDEARPIRNPVDTVSGQDADGVVTVRATPSAEVVSVTLAAGWRDIIDPRQLHINVLAAANAATMQALAGQVEEIGEGERRPPAKPDAARSEPAPDNTPLTRADVLRLVDAVSADLENFSHRLSAIVDRTVSAQSAGRHVSGSASRGRLVEVMIDIRWAGRVRDAEIESELVDILRKLQRDSSPGDLANGPQSPAITELMRLASDPQTFLRRLGLLT